MVDIGKTSTTLATGIMFLLDGLADAQKQSKITIIVSTSLLVFLVTNIKLATHQIFNTLNRWQDSPLRSAVEWSFTVISASVLAASATIGFGLASSKWEAFHAAIIGLSILFGSVAILAAGIDLYEIIQDFRQRRNLPRAIAQPHPVVAVAAPNE